MWTQEDLAEAVFDNRSRKGYISEIERALRTVSDETVNRIADVLEFSPSERLSFIKGSRKISSFSASTHTDFEYAEGASGSTEGGVKKVDIVIFLNSQLPFTKDCEDALRSITYSSLLHFNIYANFHTEDIPPTDTDSDTEMARSKIDEVIEDWQPHLICTIGTGPSVHVSNAIKSRLKYRENTSGHVYLMVADPSAVGLSQIPEEGKNYEVCGVAFSLNLKRRLQFIRDNFLYRKLAIVYDQNYRVDRNGLEELKGLADWGGIKWTTHSIEECLAAKLDNINGLEAEIIVAMNGVHHKMRKLSELSQIPIFGAGRVDVRNGATFAISEDERRFASICAQRVIIPHLVDRRPLSSIRPLTTALDHKSWRHDIFVNVAAVERFRVKISPHISRTAFFIK